MVDISGLSTVKEDEVGMAYRRSAASLTPKIWPLVLCAGLGLATLGLSGCNQLTRLGIGTTPIQKVVADPGQYEDVTVRGEVINKFSIIGNGAYQLQDQDGGTLWVITTAGTPPVGQPVTVRGKAAEGISLGGRNFGVTISEQERF